MEEQAFGRYTLLSLIGQGGMGKVFRAHDPLLQRDVAIKVLPAELNREPGYQDRFRREALIAGRLNEQHVIPVHDVGEVNGHLYLVMPIIQGVDLGELLRRAGPLSAQRAVRIVDQLAQALDAAHAAGLVHRDVKPSNALITQRDNAYLIDFGIAHDTADTRLTSTGYMMGTAAYMAPERFETGVADARSDVYALTCLLYECLTAAQPFPGSSMPQQMHAHLYTAPPRPSHQQRSVPAGFDDVIARGMAKNPDLRYQTASELAVAAEHALRIASSTRTFHAPTPLSQSPVAFAPRVATRPSRWSNRRLGLGTLVIVAALVAVIVTAVSITGHDSSPRTAAESADTTTGRTEPPPPLPPPPVALGQLEQLLLSPVELNGVMGSTDMTVAARSGTLQHEGGISPPNCQALADVADSDAYANSGWTDNRGQTLIGTPGPNGHAVVQDVVLFPSPAQAQAFMAASQETWQSCSNTKFVDATGKGTNYSSGPLSNQNGTIAVRVDNVSLSCQRALKATNNVVIDVAACGNSATLVNQAVAIVDQIAAKIPT